MSTFLFKGCLGTDDADCRDGSEQNPDMIALDYFAEQLIIYCSCRPPPTLVTL